MTLGVREADRFNIMVHLTWEICYKELERFENIPVE
jgi:hypothetical protein